MHESDERIVEYERLNILGKAAFLGGSAVRFTADLIDAAVHRAADVYLEAERAFKQGLDPNIEDAKVIGEHDERLHSAPHDHDREE